MVTSRTHPRPGVGAPPIVDFYIRALLGIDAPIELAFELPLRRTSGFARRRAWIAPGDGGFRGVAFACLRWSSEKGEWMKAPAIRSLSTVSLEEALAYLDASDGNELNAAHALARDRNRMDGSSTPPDDAEIHHALFLLRRARGLEAPSFDLMRVQLRRRPAA
jgi:hypothetical protein